MPILTYLKNSVSLKKITNFMKQRLDQLKKLSITARLSLFVAALLLVTIGITINNALTKQEKMAHAATNSLSGNNNSLVKSSYIARVYVTPTIYCLGSCPTSIPTPTPPNNSTPTPTAILQPTISRIPTNTPLSTTPRQPTQTIPTTPVSQTPGITLTPTINPCTTITPNVSTNNETFPQGQKKNGKGIPQQLLDLIKRLIEELLRLIGIGITPTPNPTTPPCEPSPTSIYTNTPTPTPILSISGTVLDDGPIYETHPYYYPNHSFKEITAEIPNLKDLGIKTIYLMPIWEQTALKPNNFNYIYHISDYYKINSMYGTPEDLKNLINTAHGYGIKTIFDMINCCAIEGDIGWTKNWILSKPLSEIKSMGLPLEYANKDGKNYVFSGCDQDKKNCKLAGQIIGNNVLLFHPNASLGYAVDRTNPEVISYFTNMAEYYVTEYGIDGWRLDVPVNNYLDNIITGDHSSLPLLRSVRQAVLEANPAAILISESQSTIRPADYFNQYGKYPPPDFDEIAEASYSYLFERRALAFKTTQQLMDFFTSEEILYNRTRMRFLETHDSERINKTNFLLNKPLIVLTSTVPGVPMIQAGQEIGAKNDWIVSKSNPLVDWAGGDFTLENFYKKVFAIRSSHPALKYGDIKNVWKSGDNVLAYSRTYENETVVMAINPGSSQTTSYLNLPFAAGAVLKDELSGENFVVSDPANFSIFIPAYGSRILTSNTPTPTPTSIPLSLSQVKNAIVYERLNDNRPKRTIAEQIQILKDTKADMIFRASWRWNPMPNSCLDVPPDQKVICEDSGYSFESIKNTINEIRKEIPNIIIIGAVPAQKINKNEVDEITGKTFDQTQTWAMALDPAKWGIKSPTKDEFQGKISGSISDGYFPDITNSNYQELLLSWAKRQIDAGMDGVWIDLLFTQAGQLGKMVNDINHPAVKESYEAASKIVDEIHKYGNSKGKNIYVGTWQVIHYPYTAPKLDFITITPTSQEILNKYFNATQHDAKITEIRNTYPNIPIFSFIDWSNDGAPLSVFSQKLSKNEQASLLKTADEFYSSRGVNFIYPVHGGNTGASSTVKAYGQYNWYDSMAPEFQTYETIKELANKKATK